MAPGLVVPYNRIDTIFLDVGNTLISIDFDWIAAQTPPQTPAQKPLDETGTKLGARTDALSAEAKKLFDEYKTALEARRHALPASPGRACRRRSAGDTRPACDFHR